MGKARKLHKLDTLLTEWRESGSPDSFLVEVNRYAFRRVIMKVDDYGHASDIAQLTTIYVWKNISKFNPARSSIANWVRMTTDSMLNDHLESRYREKGLIIDGLDPQEVNGMEDDHAFFDTSS